MGFAVPDRPREVRMEAAYFLQQLCQSRFRVSPFCGCNVLLLFYLKKGLGHLSPSMQLLDIANVHSLSWNTCFGGFSRG